MAPCIFYLQVKQSKVFLLLDGWFDVLIWGSTQCATSCKHFTHSFVVILWIQGWLHGPCIRFPFCPSPCYVIIITACAYCIPICAFPFSIPLPPPPPPPHHGLLSPYTFPLIIKFCNVFLPAECTGIESIWTYIITLFSFIIISNKVKVLFINCTKIKWRHNCVRQLWCVAA